MSQRNLSSEEEDKIWELMDSGDVRKIIVNTYDKQSDIFTQTVFTKGKRKRKTYDKEEDYTYEEEDEGWLKRVTVNEREKPIQFIWPEELGPEILDLLADENCVCYEIKRYKRKKK